MSASTVSGFRVWSQCVVGYRAGAVQPALDAACADTRACMLRVVKWASELQQSAPQTAVARKDEISEGAQSGEQKRKQRPSTTIDATLGSAEVGWDRITDGMTDLQAAHAAGRCGSLSRPVFGKGAAADS